MYCETITVHQKKELFGGIKTTLSEVFVTPDQGLNIMGRYTDKNKTGITFIVLDVEGDGQRFRQVFDEALRNAAM